MSLVDSVMDIQFPPQNYIRMGTDPNVSQNLPFGVMDSRLIFRLKVIRPFINMVEIPRQVMFTVYVTSTPYDPLVQQIELRGVAQPSVTPVLAIQHRSGPALTVGKINIK